MIHRGCVIILCILFSSASLFAQTDNRAYMQKGNELYNAQEYKKAAIAYKQALLLDSTQYAAWSNFGKALYKNKKYILAAEAFEKSLHKAQTHTEKSEALYNLGNAYLMQEEYEKAVQYYKQSLKLKYDQADCRYNLSYAQAKLKEKQARPHDEKPSDEKPNNPKLQPTALALYYKHVSDSLIALQKYNQALDSMTIGMTRDSSMNEFSEYVERLKAITQIADDKK